MTALPNKREILENILNEIEPGWWIKKPSPADPYDVEYLCIFQKPSENKEAEAWIPNALFWGNDAAPIKQTVVAAIRNAKVVK